MLKTGTEHWKSNYQGSVCDPAKESRGFNKTVSHINGKVGQTRAQSTGKANDQIDEEVAKAQSYKNRPYINDAKTGITDYRFNYGEKIGSHPKQLLDQTSFKQPLRNHPLKHGTNQLWT
jgi:hypothetical protein